MNLGVENSETDVLKRVHLKKKVTAIIWRLLAAFAALIRFSFHQNS